MKMMKKLLIVAAAAVLIAGAAGAQDTSSDSYEFILSKIAASEGIHADVALAEEPAPHHHPPVARRGGGVDEPASHRAIPVGADHEVEVH